MRGHALVILVLSIPFLLPIPLPGLSSLLGIVICSSAIGIIFEWPIRVPKAFANKEIPKQTFSRVLEKAQSVVVFFEKIIKKRYWNLAPFRITEISVGVMLLLMGLILTLPLPPGGNLLPSIVLVTLSLSWLEKDGLGILLGFILGVTLIGVFFSVIQMISVWILKRYDEVDLYTLWQTLQNFLGLNGQTK